MTTPAFEAFLVRLYVDEDVRQRFLIDPLGTAGAAGLSPEECAALDRIDRVGLALAVESFARKRRTMHRTRWWHRLAELARSVAR